MSLTAASPREARGALRARLHARRNEIAQAILTRIRAVSPFDEQDDPEYADGVRGAVVAAIDYAISSIENEEDASLRQPPAALLEQARASARRGIGLDLVLRRYCIGYSLLVNVLIEEAARPGQMGEMSLRRLLWAQAELFDHLIATVGNEHTRERRPPLQSPNQRRLERAERILAGEPLDFLDAGYELEDWHLGLIAEGATVVDAIRRLARSLDRRAIVVERPEGTAWAWLGGKDRLDPERVERRLADTWPHQSPAAIGEPGIGRAGWRITHQQARAAMPIAQRSEARYVRYRDVALLSSVSRDDLLATSLRELYLDPLVEGTDGGGVLIETLRTYFASDRNVSATAAALEVNRRTVTNRLRTIEERLGCSLLAGTAEIEAALRLQELEPLSSAYTR
jgi:hypothetical protein